MSGLRIGIDARELLGETTGVGRYLGELIRRWTARTDAAARQFTLYAPAPLDRSWQHGTIDTRVLPGGTGTWWEQTALRTAVQKEKPDVFFAPAYTAPIGLGPPFAVTIHDISFIAHPEWFRPRERLRRRVLTTRTARAARVVFTDSEFSSAEIQKYLKVDPGRLHVIPPGVSPPATPGLRAPDPGPRSPLVLFAGSLFNRRRLPDLIEAFARVATALPDARLAIVGADRTWPRQDLSAIAAARGIQSRVEISNYLDEGSLGRLYATASVFAFLSEYEGFGLTPLEALASGVPVVVLDTPIAREIYGPAAAYVQRGDIDGTAQALLRFLTSRDAAREQLAFAAEVLGRYSWTRAADETLRHLESLAQR